MSLADVYVGDVLAARIEQTLEHSVFTYRSDFPPTSLPGGGLAINLPRDDNWKGKDFITFFGRFGLPERACRSALAQLVEESPPWIERIGEIGFDAKITERVIRSIRRRREQLATS